MPFVLFELPLALLVMVGVMKNTIERRSEPERSPFFPSVSCIITCYSEGRDVQKTIMSLTEQIYPGKIEMLAMIDGAFSKQAYLRFSYGDVRVCVRLQEQEAHRGP